MKLIRQEYGYGPLDIGLFGSFHFADYSDVKVKATELKPVIKTDIKHYRWLAQGVKIQLNPSLSHVILILMKMRK